MVNDEKIITLLLPVAACKYLEKLPFLVTKWTIKFCYILCELWTGLLEYTMHERVERKFVNSPDYFDLPLTSKELEAK